MNTCIEALSLSSETGKNKTTKTSKKSNGETFENTLNKFIIDSDRLSKIKLQIKIDKALERLGSFFGFGKTLMEEILKSLKINPEDLLDPAQRDYIVKALAKKLGLVKDREDALAELIGSFQK